MAKRWPRLQATRRRATRCGSRRLGFLRHKWSLFCVLGLTLVAAATLAIRPAAAFQPITLDAEQDRIEITQLVEAFEGRGDQLQVETAAGADGIAGRMSVRAAVANTNPSWVVFALRNPSDKPIERWVTADRYNIIGSNVLFPDLDARRIESVTPSLGFVPDRIANDRADIFLVTLNPGQTITYAAEMASDRFPRMYVWKALAFEQRNRSQSLFNGIMLGITGLLAIFLTAIFAANHKAIFPSAALVAWCVLGYLCIDFGFWHKLFQQLKPESNATYRAMAEAAVAASLVMFLFTFLRVRHWHSLIRFLYGLWIIAQLVLIAFAPLDPRLASTFARSSFFLIAAAGSLHVLWLALRGQDRALSLVPTWLLFLVWLFAAATAVHGQLLGEPAVYGIVSGLVLIVTLIGFTVTQFAFRAQEPIYGSTPNQLQLRAQAIEASGAGVWEWNARRDEISVGPVVEELLGLPPGDLSTRLEDWMQHLHPADRERFRLVLWGVQEKDGGSIRMDFRLRRADSTYKWFELVAASNEHGDHRSLRCVGLLRDITETKRSHERLLHDAVHDNLTGLPNRELFSDRLGQGITRAKTNKGPRPTIIFIDIDRFKAVNTAFGVIVGDSLLLTLARRLTRHLGPEDTLARVGGDQFAILLGNDIDPREIALLAERIRRSLRSPINIQGKEVVMTGSLGIAVFDPAERDMDLLRDAEIAMYRAKRAGTDRIEIFRPDMRSEREDRLRLESDLRLAVERRQLKIFYQPIMYLPNEDLAGFEALVRWDHPTLGLLGPSDFVPIAEESDLIVKLGSYVLETAAQEAAKWQNELPREEAPLFVSVNVSSRQLFRQDLITEVRHILGREIVPKGSLRLEITESLVMENPEQAAEMLEQLRAAGANLALDDFGTGYSSLAYLQRFPFDVIKVDRGLIRESSGGGSATVIVRSIVALAEELQKKVVAEGIETPEDAAFLRSIGCEYGQGYYYGEPVSDREVIDHLRLVRKTDKNVERRWGFGAAAKRAKKNELRSETTTTALVPVAAEPAMQAVVAPPAEKPPKKSKLARRAERRRSGSAVTAPPVQTPMSSGHTLSRPTQSGADMLSQPGAAPFVMPAAPSLQRPAHVPAQAPRGASRLSTALARLTTNGTVPAGRRDPRLPPVDLADPRAGGQPIDTLARLLQSAAHPVPAPVDVRAGGGANGAIPRQGTAAAAASMAAIAAAIAPPGQRRRDARPSDPGSAQGDPGQGAGPPNSNASQPRQRK